jgi:outer membrane protein
MILKQRLSSAAAVLVAGAFSLVAAPAMAETIHGALARAYNANPDINAQRAVTRATDEAVPQALSGYRPKLTGAADMGASDLASQTNGGKVNRTVTQPRSVSVTLDQVIYNGNRTHNAVRGAESRVLAARETLRNTEQATLLNAATVYMNVLRDTALLSLQRNNIEVLTVQLNQTNDRFRVGEVTRTDVAQAESRLAKARSDSFAAESNLKTSIATYRQIVGDEPKQLSPAKSVENLLPKNREATISLSLREHPAIIAALHGVDAQTLTIKTIEGELLPTLSLSASALGRHETSISGNNAWGATVTGRLSVPLYEGGLVYSRVREAKENLTNQRMQVDSQRERIRQYAVSTWGALEAAKAQIKAAEAGVRAAEIALAGVREEAKVGQRTTLDVLNAQQDLLITRTTLVTAQRDRIVASYSVLSATGRLTLRTLGIRSDAYDPKVHYEQVRDKWIGLRTPDGQ